MTLFSFRISLADRLTESKIDGVIISPPVSRLDGVSVIDPEDNLFHPEINDSVPRGTDSSIVPTLIGAERATSQ